MKKLNKKTIVGFIIGLLLTTTSIMAGATVVLVFNTQVEENAHVGNTIRYDDALFVQIKEYDNHTLTYFDVPESDTEKHYLTYIYDYQVLEGNKNIEVSSLSSDIVINELSYTDTTITITFSLNQDTTFSEGDVINILFYFNAVDVQQWNGYTVDNPINMNTASSDELIAIGFTESQASTILLARQGNPFSDLTNMGLRIGMDLSSYQEYFDQGYIVFN